MNVPTQSELMHLKIQAAMREYDFPEDQMKYLGIRNHEHWYLVANEHEVPVTAIEGFDRND
jgi:hypothetical protein